MEPLAVWYAFWLVCLFRWHQVLQQRFGTGYMTKAPLGVVGNLVAGAAAPWVAMQLVGVLSKGLFAFDDLVLQLFPNSVQIVHSAIYLVDTYGVVIGAALAAGGVLWGYERLGSKLSEHTRAA